MTEAARNLTLPGLSAAAHKMGKLEEVATTMGMDAIDFNEFRTDIMRRYMDCEISQVS